MEKIEFPDPVCGGGNGDATYLESKHDWMIDCWSASCRALGGAYLPELAERLGLGRGASKVEIVAALRELPSSRGVATGKQVDLPDEDRIHIWADRLIAPSQPLGYLADAKPLSFLTDDRGISLEVIREAEIGLDDGLLVFPIRLNGEIVAAKTRPPKRGAQMRAWPGQGRPWPLYPEPEPEPEWPWGLVVAGELDPLRGRSAGLPATSVTLGAGTWREEWTETLRGRFVVVAFDNDEQHYARKRVETLRAAGIRARRLDLRSLGLRSRKGDLSDYLERWRLGPADSARRA